MTSTIDAPPLAPGAAAPGTDLGGADALCGVVVRRLPDPADLPPRPPARRPGPTPEAEPEREDRGSLAEPTVVLRMMLEVLDGRRPAAQLTGRVTPSVRRYLTAAVGRLDRAVPGRPTVRAARCGPPALRSVHGCHPADGVCEVSAGWRYRGRHRALAARFEWTAGRWTCTALRLG